jgi:2-polyprenyl-3-methyl-5-hydroxy-6-metoxy-1,4-benzoquinol methylase
MSVAQPSNIIERPHNVWKWSGMWNPEAVRAVDFATALFPETVQNRGFARGYYGYIWIVGEILRAFPEGIRGKRIIDIGSGAGLLPIALQHLGAEATAFDRFEEYEETFDNQMGVTADLIRRMESVGVTVKRGDILADIDKDAAQPGQYDLVLCTEVVEHFPVSPRRMMEGSARLLKPGGLLLITTPNHAWLRTRLRLLFGRTVHFPLETWWDEPYFGHIREYLMPELTTMFRWSGFEVVRSTYSNSYHLSSRYWEDGQERWTTRFTLNSPVRWMIAGSLLVTSLFPSLKFSMLVVGRKPT